MKDSKFIAWFRALSLACCADGFANPNGLAIVEGSALVTENGACLDVATSSGAILNWDSFSIAPNETTRFIQPTAKSSVLNKVVGSEMSQLMGLLQSNGQVYLVNPNGILIGKEGRIDTAGFFAVARDGDISHLGSIEAGAVELSARNIEVQGTINMSSVVDANALVFEDGKLFLRAEETLMSSGDFRGGDIQLFGKQIALTAGTLDASGIAGGGEILIGGDTTRGVAGRLYAENTLVGEGVSILADAIQSGNGGTVVVWANDTTEFHGQLSARALGSTGDGGFVEVSGAKSLMISTHPDLRSNCGKSGTLLLDPGSVTIAAGSVVGMCPTFGDDYISSQLELGDVVISTSCVGASGAETITIESGVDISWSTSSSLTLSAGQNIIAASGGQFLSFGSGSIILETTQPSGMQAPGSYDGIYLNGFTFNTGSGTLSLTGVGGTVNSGATCNGVNLTGCTLGLGGPTAISGSAGGDATGGVNNVGVWMNTTTINTSGEFDVTGIGGPNAGGITDANSGIVFTNSMINNSLTAQNISFNGTAGGSLHNTYGVQVDNFSTIELSGDGQIILQGTGSAANSSGCAGFAIGANISGSQITLDGPGPISIIGSYAADNQTSNFGILLNSNSDSIGIEIASGGQIELQGTISGSGGMGNSAIGSSTTSTTAFTLIGGADDPIATFSGDASGMSGGDNNAGILLYSFDLGPLAVGGTLSLTGAGGTGTGTGNFGVGLINPRVSVSGGGTLACTIDGTASSTGSMNHGVTIENLNTASGFQASVSVSGDTASTLNSYGVSIAQAGSDPFFTSFGIATETSNALLDASSSVRLIVAQTSIDLDIGGSLTVISGSATTLSVSEASGTISLTTGGDLVFNETTDSFPVLSTSTGNNTIAVQAGGRLTLNSGFYVSTSGNSLSLQGSAISMNGTTVIDAGGGTAVITGPITLGATTTITASGPALEFASSISSPSSSYHLTVNSGSKPMTFDGDVGSLANPLGALSFTSSNGSTGIDLFGVNLYGVSAAFSGLVSLSGASSVNTTTGAQVFGAIGGTQNLTLNATSGTITLGGVVGSNTAPLGAFTINCGAPSEGTILSNGTIYANSLIFNSIVTNTAACAINSSGAVAFNSTVNGGNNNYTIDSGNLTIGAVFSTTGGGGLGNINCNSTGTISFSNSSSMTTSDTATITLQAANHFSIGSNVTIESGSGDMLFVAGTNFTSGINLTVLSSSADTTLTFVVDNANPSPPNVGSGVFQFSSGNLLCTNLCAGGAGKVLLYTSMPAGNSFPSIINAESYTPGSYNSSGTYVPGTNEFVGYWYNVPPSPPDPAFEVIYKSATVVSPGKTPLMQGNQLLVATVEPVLTSPEALLLLTTGMVPTLSPWQACKGTPSIAIRVHEE